METQEKNINTTLIKNKTNKNDTQNLESISFEKIKQLAKKTAKDSVFRDLFKDPKYLLMLYQTLHPEDINVTKKDIGTVTINNVLLDQLYNDLGFMVGDKILVLVEAQSSWTVNMVIRCLMYLVQTWHEYIESTNQNVYASKAVKLPKPELYVIYTGDKKKHTEWITLSEEFFGGQKAAVEVKVKVLYGKNDGDIISQYVTFTKIYNEQVKKLGRTKEAVVETIRICKDKNILKEYLKNREKEVVDIMMTLFDEEYILKTYVAQKEKAAAEQATKQTEINTKKEMVLNLSKRGFEINDIAEIVNINVDTIKQWLDASMAVKV